MNILPIRPLRSAGITTLIDAITLDDAPTSYSSAALDCSEFSKFLLFLSVDSTATPTTVQFKVEFSNDGGTTWFALKQGEFAALFYEDGDTASGIFECFFGNCIGRTMRVTAVGTGTTSANKFLISAYVELMN